jgi:hypothetical protein
VELFATHLGPWDHELQGELTKAAMAENPDDWYVVVDLDEFHVMIGRWPTSSNYVSTAVIFMSTAVSLTASPLMAGFRRLARRNWSGPVRRG